MISRYLKSRVSGRQFPPRISNFKQTINNFNSSPKDEFRQTVNYSKKPAALGNERTTRLSRNYRANPFAEASESFPVAAPMVFLEFLPLWRAHVPGNTCHGHILGKKRALCKIIKHYSIITSRNFQADFQVNMSDFHRFSLFPCDKSG